MTRIIDRRRLCYMPKIGFVSTFKIFVFSLLSTLSLVAVFSSDSFVTPAQAHYIPVEPSLQQKMVEYMQHRNSNISNVVAYKLADAIVVQKYKYGIPVEVQLGQITVESNFDQYALGSAGELGFYQVHPRWHSDRIHALMKNGEIKTKNIYDPFTNASVAMNVLNECINKSRKDVQRGLVCYNGTGDEAVSYAKRVIYASKDAKRWI